MRQSAGSAGCCIALHPARRRFGWRTLLRVPRGLGPCPLCYPRRLWLPARRPPRHGALARRRLPRPLPPRPAVQGRGGTSTPPLHPDAVHERVSCGVVMSTKHKYPSTVAQRARVWTHCVRRTPQDGRSPRVHVPCSQNRQSLPRPSPPASPSPRCMCAPGPGG